MATSPSFLSQRGRESSMTEADKKYGHPYSIVLRESRVNKATRRSTLEKPSSEKKIYNFYNFL
jgi:hypothetical protein